MCNRYRSSSLAASRHKYMHTITGEVALPAWAADAHPARRKRSATVRNGTLRRSQGVHLMCRLWRLTKMTAGRGWARVGPDASSEPLADWIARMARRVAATLTSQRLSQHPYSGGGGGSAPAGGGGGGRLAAAAAAAAAATPASLGVREWKLRESSDSASGIGGGGGSTVPSGSFVPATGGGGGIAAAPPLPEPESAPSALPSSTSGDPPKVDGRPAAPAPTATSMVMPCAFSAAVMEASSPLFCATSLITCSSSHGRGRKYS